MAWECITVKATFSMTAGTVMLRAFESGMTLKRFTAYIAAKDQEDTLPYDSAHSDHRYNLNCSKSVSMLMVTIVIVDTVRLTTEDRTGWEAVQAHVMAIQQLNHHI